MQFSFAHLSDVHLGPMPVGSFFHDFALKRLTGGLSWALNRRHIHAPEVAQLLAQDVLAAKPDHIAVTGDVVNVAARSEFSRALTWLQQLGKTDDVSFTPGNHDAYVSTSFPAVSHFEPYMSGDMRRQDARAFPYIRLRRNIAFIGLNSACPQSLFKAGGTLGRDQIAALAGDLAELKSRGFYRVVMLHHPPLPDLARPRKALTDARELSDVLTKYGAELVIHGHNHRQMFNWLETKPQVPVHGVASASSTGHGHHQPAAWHRYTVDRSKGQWRTMVAVRSFNPQTRQYATTQDFELNPPQ